MDLTLFDDVLVLLEEGNMSRAARRRNVTQPAFSRRIRSFETWLGRPIIKRDSNRVEIEPALLANSAELQALVGHVRELRQRLAGYDPGRSIVTIAAQHSLIQSAFPEFAAAARQRYPVIGFRVRAANHNECMSLFLRGEASLLMCYERQNDVDLPFDDGIVRSVWGQDRLIPVVGGSLRFSLSVDGRPPADLPVIIYPPRSFFGETLARAGVTNLNDIGHAIAESAFSAGIKEMALAGLGLAWLPMSLIYNEVQSGTLVTCNHDNDTVPLSISLFAQPSNKVATQLCGLR
ncbi:MAG: LysR family transcriptional regulator [Nitratireductor sp.]|nr:LysR family transcriptional regulator [Nitratireductor sp.]